MFLEEELYEATEDEEEIWEVLSNINTENKNKNEYSNHKIGGYPYFTQNDVLLDKKHFDTLLLQIDTDDENGIMWGYCGVGNFFIKKENLQSLQFSTILFTWDCC